MKHFFTILLLTLLVSCGTQKIVSYEYSATTRGYKKLITVEEDSTTVTISTYSDTKTEVFKTSPEFWQSIEAASEDIDLKKIADLPSPTNRRQTDAAMFSKIKFITADSTFTSSTFDNGQPPAMLKTVVDSLVNMAK